MRLTERVRWQRVTGEPMVVNDLTLTPESRVLVVRLPRAAFVWQRPTALLVARDGSVERHAIFDLTRIMQVGLFGLGLAIAIVSLILRVRREEGA